MLTDEAILLRSYPFQETSMICVWLTIHHGIIRTVFKGAHKKNKHSATPDLFFLCHIHWKHSRTSELHSLLACDILNPGFNIGSDYPKLALASYCSKIISATVEPEFQVPAVFTLMLKVLLYLEHGEPTVKALFRFEQKLVDALSIDQPHTPPHVLLADHGGNRQLVKQRASLLSILPHPSTSAD